MALGKVLGKRSQSPGSRNGTLPYRPHRQRSTQHIQGYSQGRAQTAIACKAHVRTGANHDSVRRTRQPDRFARHHCLTASSWRSGPPRKIASIWDNFMSWSLLTECDRKRSKSDTMTLSQGLSDLWTPLLHSLSLSTEAFSKRLVSELLDVISSTSGMKLYIVHVYVTCANMETDFHKYIGSEESSETADVRKCDDF